MKRVIVVTLLLSMLMFVTACGSQSAVSPYVGTWTVHEIQSDGYSVPAEDAGITMTITFKDDGTYVETIGDYTHDGEWHEVDEGVVKMVAGIEYMLTLNDSDQLVYDMEGALCLYDKEN